MKLAPPYLLLVGVVMTEEWRAVSGYEGRYEVSNLGRLRSLRLRPPRALACTPNEEGYPIVQLCNRGRKMMKLHRVVALTFHPGKQNKLHNEVAHLDGNRANARADNLKWVSKLENHSHRFRHGTNGAGERHPRAKLTASQVTEIRLRQGTARELARHYGVSRHTIYDIWQGNRWQSCNPA